jgi:hypothetical protein
MYLNYDGKGSAFGGTSVHAISAARGQLAIYAAQRSTGSASPDPAAPPKALTIIVINKTHHAMTSPMSVKGLAASATAQVYQYGPAHPRTIVHEPAQSFSNGAASVTFPGYSITELVVPASGLTRAAAQPRPATGTGTASAAVPATSPGPADGFLRAVGYSGAKVADGWNPNTVRRCHSEPSLTGAGC